LFGGKMSDSIVEETNNYHDFCTGDATHNTASHQAKWLSTNRSEMYTFLATIMLISVTKKNKILDYRTTDPMIATSMFRELFSRDRYIALLKYVHFNDNSNQVDDDSLYKIRPVMDELQKRFKLLISSYKNLCIDEALLLWKGRLAFKQYISSKRRRFVIATQE
jgi:hypothetical protein